MQALCYPARAVRRMESTMAEPFKHISARKKDGIIRIDFVERNILDELNIHQIGVELAKAIESQSNPKVVVVFGNVEHMSSAAYGTLMKFQERIKVCTGQLRLCEMKPRLYEGFVITKLNRLFTIVEDYQAAVDSFK